MAGLINTSATRERIEKPHYVFWNGKMGQITTLSCTEVAAGDSYETHLVGAAKLAAMRRNMSLDGRFDLYAFFVPHRHCYEEDEWIRFCMDGPSQPELPNMLGQLEIVNRYQDPDAHYLGLSGQTDATFSVPGWRKRGYWNIINNYFKRPEDEDWEDTSHIELDVRKYGMNACRLKNIWSADVPQSLRQNQWVDTSSNELSIEEFVQQAAALDVETNIDRFTQRYRDWVDNQGGSTTSDVDQRPTIIATQEKYMSGYDVDGTTETTLGQYSGRSQFKVDFKVPRFYCREHGAVWILAVARFDPILQAECNQWEKFWRDNNTYEMVIQDPTLTANQRPYFTNMGSFVTTSAAGEQFEVAFQQSRRHSANIVSEDYVNLQGYPFLTDIPATAYTRRYCQPKEYDQVFQTQQLADWNCQLRNNIVVHSRQPSTRNQIMTVD